MTLPFISSFLFSSLTLRITPFIVSAFNSALPFLFDYLSYFEAYSTPLNTIRATIARLISFFLFFQLTQISNVYFLCLHSRSYLVRLASIYVLLFGYVDADQNEDFNSEVSSSKTFLFYREWDQKPLSLFILKENCWETQIGQEFYQLVWVNFALEIISTFGVAFSMTWGYRFWKRDKEKHWEFDIPDNVLDLIYEQALIWFLHLLFN